jgi:hypothetical protein
MDSYRPEYAGAKRGLKARYFVFLTLLAFVTGGILTVWAVQKYNLLGSSAAAVSGSEVASQAPTEPAFDSLPPPIAPATDAPVTEKVEDLEARLSQINESAEAASGNAARAEGMLLAFAARRAIDSGAALGYIEGQLQARFGTSRPADVAAVIQANRRPVTLDSLRGEINSQGNNWLVQDGQSFWQRAKTELNELFVLRNENTPSPAPTRRLERARQFAEVGNIKDAVAEIERLPGAKQAGSWLEKARRYVAVRAALDNIERAALAQPAMLIKPEAPAAPEATPVVPPASAPQEQAPKLPGSPIE